MHDLIMQKCVDFPAFGVQTIVLIMQQKPFFKLGFIDLAIQNRDLQACRAVKAVQKVNIVLQLRKLLFFCQ